VFEEIGVEL